MRQNPREFKEHRQFNYNNGDFTTPLWKMDSTTDPTRRGARTGGSAAVPALLVSVKRGTLRRSSEKAHRNCLLLTWGLKPASANLKKWKSYEALSQTTVE